MNPDDEAASMPPTHCSGHWLKAIQGIGSMSGLAWASCENGCPMGHIKPVRSRFFIMAGLAHFNSIA